MLRRRRIERTLREIARNPELSGADQVSEQLESNLRAQIPPKVHIPLGGGKVQEVIPMFLRNKVTVSVVATTLLIGAVVLFVVLGTTPMPTFAELLEASEAAAAQVNSLRLIIREEQGGKPQDAEEIFVKNPFFVRGNSADGSYGITTIDKQCDYDKSSNTFSITPHDMKALLKEVGLRPDTPATFFYTKHFLDSVLKQPPKGVEIPDHLKIEDVVLKGKHTHKVSYSDQASAQDVEIYFDKPSGLLVRMDFSSGEGRSSAEVVEVNPELDDSLFSMEPPPGAKVVDMTKKEAPGD